MTGRQLAALIAALPQDQQDLEVYVTNGDLPDAPAASATVQAADYGQLFLISR
jgi:hypothetical protein